MSTVSTGDTETTGEQGGRLVPLARRRHDADPFDDPSATPGSVAAELLERAAHLINTLIGDVAALREDQKKERARIEEEAEAQEAAADGAERLLDDLAERAREVAARKGKVEDLDGPLTVPLDVPPDAGIDLLVEHLEEEVRLAKGITGAIRLPVIGALQRLAHQRLDQMRNEVRAMRDRLLAETEDELNAEGKEALASYEIGLGVLARDIETLSAHLPPASNPWDHDAWAAWSPPERPARWLRYGLLEHEDLVGQRIPALWELPGSRGLALEHGGHRDRAVEGVRSLLLRILASFPPGGVRLTLIDPTAVGAALAPFLPLGEHDPQLIDGGIATTGEEIEARLGDLAQHLEVVAQQHLRGRYESLAELCAAAGEVVEPFRVVVLVDYPTQITERSHQLVQTLIENGPRAGVFTVLVAAHPVPGGQQAKVKRVLSLLDRIVADEDGFNVEVPLAGTWRLALDELPTTALTGPDGALSLFGRVLTTVGEQARIAQSRPPTSDQVLGLLADAARLRLRDDVPAVATPPVPGAPDSWWQAPVEAGLALPVGRTAARDGACLWLDAAHPWATVAAPARSDLRSLLDEVLFATGLLYGPDQLELRLVHLGDRGPGVRLPHVALSAPGAEREVALRVLDDLLAEVGARHAGGKGRSAAGAGAPRVLTVITGAEQLLGPDDELSDLIGGRLDELARQGGAAGVHVLLATEAAESVDDRVRDVLLRAPARLVLRGAAPEMGLWWRAGDAVDLGLRPGDAVLVGSPSADGPVAVVPMAAGPGGRTGVYAALAERAATEGSLRATEVVAAAVPAAIGEAPLAQLMANPDKQVERLLPRVWLGMPVLGTDPVEVLLRRHDGRHLLVVHDDPALGQGMLVGGVVSTLLAQGRQIDVHIVDLQPRDEGIAELVKPLAGPFAVTVGRRDALEGAIGAVAAVLEARSAGQQYREPPVLLVLNGLGRARDLDARSEEEPIEEEENLVDVLERILRDGPEVGIHVLAWCDSLAALRRRLPRSARRELTVRAVGPQSARDSAALVEGDAATRLRPDQALLWDEERNQATKVRPFRLADAAFLRALADAAGGGAPRGS